LYTTITNSFNHLRERIIFFALLSIKTDPKTERRFQKSGAYR
jgi:hypothetical protein